MPAKQTQKQNTDRKARFANASHGTRPTMRSLLVGTGIMLGLLLLAPLLGFGFRQLGLPETNTAILYLLAVLLTARLTDGYLFGMLASLLAAIFFNYLFIEPYYTFSVNTHSYIVTFVIMVITALLTSTLTTHARKDASRAQQREREARALYALTNKLTEVSDMPQIAAIATASISTMLGSHVGCLCFDENGKPEPTFTQQLSGGKQIRREWAQGTLPTGAQLQAGSVWGSEFCDFPIHGRDALLGLIRVPKAAAAVLTSAQISMLNSMVESVALAMDRYRAALQRVRDNEAITQERYRANLLRAISHDLRTPLAGIMGTAEMLMNMTPAGDERYTLMQGIYQDADWLHALVENILSLTYLQDGKLILHKQAEAVEEVVGAAIVHITRLHPEHSIAATVPPELLMVPMDAKLIRQVLINLLDNAVKHTAPHAAITVSVQKDEEKHQAVFCVSDSGEGIAAQDLGNIFETFYTSHTKRSDARLGMGLGLSICEAIVKAHGGTITASNREDAPGAVFTFILPLEDQNHERV